MKKEKVILLLLVIGVALMAIVSARAVFPSTPPSSATPQVTSVDIEIANVVPALTFQSNSLGVASTGIAVSRGLSGFPGPQNLTAAFSFAPLKGFIKVNLALLTITYFASSAGADGFAVEVNRGAPVNVVAPPIPNMVVGTLNGEDLHVGANTVNMGITLGSSFTSGGTFVHQVRMTVEYTFLGA